MWAAVFKVPNRFGELEVSVGPTVRCEGSRNTATFHLELGIQKRAPTGPPMPDDGQATFFGTTTVTASGTDTWAAPVRGHPVLSGRVNSRTAPNINLDTDHFIFVKATYVSGELDQNACFFFETPVTLRYLPEVLTTDIDPR
jgi:hypothetical protein